MATWTVRTWERRDPGLSTNLHVDGPSVFSWYVHGEAGSAVLASGSADTFEKARHGADEAVEKILSKAAQDPSCFAWLPTPAPDRAAEECF